MHEQAAAGVVGAAVDVPRRLAHDARRRATIANVSRPSFVDERRVGSPSHAGE